jgi:hypothetical protein
MQVLPSVKAKVAEIQASFERLSQAIQLLVCRMLSVIRKRSFLMTANTVSTGIVRSVVSNWYKRPRGAYTAQVPAAHRVSAGALGAVKASVPMMAAA